MVIHAKTKVLMQTNAHTQTHSVIPKQVAQATPQRVLLVMETQT